MPPSLASNSKHKIGILAFGSLLTNQGPEIAGKIVARIKTLTPFGVEYGRYSGTTRGGAPTLVPHEAGKPVLGEILVLNETVTKVEAKNMLWRRETGNMGIVKAYPKGTSPNSVVAQEWTDSPDVEIVVYTDFHPAGKIKKPNAKDLATRAIESVQGAEIEKDGITYLLNNISAGISTDLTTAYEGEILRQTRASSLEEALQNLIRRLSSGNPS